MRVRPKRTSRHRADVRVVGVVAAGLLLAGCATMPSTGAPPSAPSVVGDSTQSAQQVVVVAEPPKPKASAGDLLAGFLDDLVSDEQDYHTAKEYLTKDAAAKWNPQQQVTVLKNIDRSQPVKSGNRVSIVVTGTPVAVLNARHAYEPPPDKFQKTFVFETGPQGELRLDTPPDGIILNETDFGHIYEPVNLYFPAARAQPDTGPSALVADPIYVRSHIDPLTEAAAALLGGPSGWLAPAVTTSFPPGSALGRSGVSVGSDGDPGNIRFQFGGRTGAALKDEAVCDRMAAQLYFTLSEVPTQQAQLAGQKITGVTLYQSGAETPSCLANGSSEYSPFQESGGSTSYYLDADGRLESLYVGQDADHPSPKPVPGILAPSGAGHLAAFAVAPGDSGKVAVVSNNERSLYISTLTQQKVPDHVAVGSPVVGGLSSPSWDGLGTLWVADTNPAAPAVWAVVGGSNLVRVPVVGLHGTVEGVRVAADGARIALTVKNDSGTSVEIGRIEQSGPANDPALTIDGLIAIAPTLKSVKSVSWLDGDSVIVLGQPVGSAQGLSTWEVDGSWALATAGQVSVSGDGMTTVAAMQQDSSQQHSVKAPLLGDSVLASEAQQRDNIYRLVKNGWQTVATNGATYPVGAGNPAVSNGPMPSYPG